MFWRFGNDLIGKFHQCDDDLEAQFCRHFGLQQAVHHLHWDVERVGGDVVAGVEPEVVHQHLAQFLSHKSVVLERVMVFGDALLGAFVDTEILGRKFDKTLMFSGNENIFVSGLFQIGLKGLRFECF